MQSFICISQDLKPIVQHIKTEKYFCFDINQSRDIAFRLERGQFQDSIINKMEFSLRLKDFLLVEKDSVTTFLQAKNENLLVVIDNNTEQIQYLEQNLKFKDKKIKQSKLHKILLGSGMLVLTGILIAN